MGVTQWVTPIFILINLCVITGSFRYLSYIAEQPYPSRTMRKPRLS